MSDEKKPVQMVNVTVDGKATSVPAGTNLIEAAKTVGVEIPHYCYHAGLSIAANCRMCMVEVSNAPPGKLVPGCQIPVAEGQKITTDSPRVKDQQRAVQEFLLLHHPVDCAICDQAGECRLQDYYQEYDFKPSRLDSAKWLKNKRKDLGPLIVLDQERCIMCTRCVRFMAEVAEEPVLGVFGRGTREVIDTFPGKVLDSNYSGNVVDLCPVGALLNKDNRFRARSYFLTATPSLCSGCSRGCNTFLDHFQGVPYRYRPRENQDVNQFWMCDTGRLSYHGLYENRVHEASVGGKVRPAGEALDAAARQLGELAGSKQLTVVVSPVLSLEDALAVMLLAKEGLKVSEVFVSGRANDAGDDFLLREDRNPNRKGVELAAAAFGLALRSFADLTKTRPQGVLLAGVDVPADEASVASWLAGAKTVVALAANDTPVAKAAGVVLPLATHAEGDGTFVSFEGRAQRFLPAIPAVGASRAAWHWAAALLGELGFSHRFASAGEAFAELSKRLPAGALGDFDWTKVPRTMTKGVTPLTGGTVDGRPPGWRELIPLRTPAGTSAA
ncbi:2Fe-2S iron-sulfur cluster-binding protein [Vulgatibacter incomptus]|uniref:NADH-ubiquinone oxidoreductase chain G n=1 Tax=Vulgatibacter incomptus TaxID=1391653 RepID=A0A0K1PB03_9BACT|nr:2Fe-2S iron-sulfur cluster-binding protein [Vulgatibacter incomptus]AKU90687.1 NADH-ubiquinone oxidoreductase chain G [Vulgatibacter incomptus]